jgi:hypothetical protein
MFQVRVFAVLLLMVLACSACTFPPQTSGVYAPGSRALVRVDYDFDRDGRIDVRTYMREGRPVRLEGDSNGDGLIDRWEYYGASGELLRIGGSSGGNGLEDTWVRTAGDERHVEISTRRDRIVDRLEVYRADRLVRIESDTNRDGLPDMWEAFTDGSLTELLLDDDKRYGRPTRRLVYGPGGTARVEILDKEDGHASR